MAHRSLTHNVGEVMRWSHHVWAVGVGDTIPQWRSNCCGYPMLRIKGGRSHTECTSCHRKYKARYGQAKWLRDGERDRFTDLEEIMRP